MMNRIDEIETIKKFLAKHRDKKFFGQVILSYDNGRVVSVKSVRTLKMKDIEKLVDKK